MMIYIIDLSWDHLGHGLVGKFFNCKFIAIYVKNEIKNQHNTFWYSNNTTFLGVWHIKILTLLLTWQEKWWKLAASKQSPD